MFSLHFTHQVLDSYQQNTCAIVLFRDMKQKIIVKVQMNCQKCRTKALKTAADVDGVDYVGLQGDDKDRIVVTGDGVDPVKLTKSLRKIGWADIVSVEEVKPPKKPSTPPPCYRPCYYIGQPNFQMARYEVIEDYGSRDCSIM